MVKKMIKKQDDKKNSYQQSKKKFCRFCADTTYILDYKDPQVLKYFLTEGGKITPRRISGNCAKHQRKLALEVKRARMMSILPFVVKGN